MMSDTSAGLNIIKAQAAIHVLVFRFCIQMYAIQRPRLHSAGDLLLVLFTIMASALLSASFALFPGAREGKLQQKRADDIWHSPLSLLALQLPLRPPGLQHSCLRSADWKIPDHPFNYQETLNPTVPKLNM